MDNDLRQRLLRAIIDGRLVVFCGAGLSMAQPSRVCTASSTACVVASGAADAEPLDSVAATCRNNKTARQQQSETSREETHTGQGKRHTERSMVAVTVGRSSL